MVVQYGQIYYQLISCVDLGVFYSFRNISFLQREKFICILPKLSVFLKLNLVKACKDEIYTSKTELFECLV